MSEREREREREREKILVLDERVIVSYAGRVTIGDMKNKNNN